MLNIMCIFHAGCTDGAAAAGVVYNHFRSANEYNVVLIAARYGQPFPPIPATTDEIYIVDFSYSKEVLIEKAKYVKQIHVFDHHANAMETLMEGYAEWNPGNVNIVYDPDKSGAVITFEQLVVGQNVPKSLRHVQDYDLWRKEMLNTNEFSAAVQGRDAYWWANEGIWASASTLGSLYGQGDILLTAQQRQIHAINKTVREITIPTEGGVHILVPAANTPILQNEICEYLMKTTDATVVVAYYDTEEHRKFSIRSDGSVDVAAIARLYGGNGHAAAAGFSVPRDHHIAAL